MKPKKEPMPLSELPEYIRSVREGGSDYGPVVDMGRIVDDRPKFGLWKYAAAACLLVAASGLYTATATREIVIDAGGAGERAVADIVSGEGGRVFSVSREDDGTYRVRVLTFDRLNSFVDRLRAKEDFKRVEVGR